MAGYSNHSGKNQSGKVAGADPDVDERLKNIEPKMIELITTEVRSQEELWSVIHILESPDRSALAHTESCVFCTCLLLPTVLFKVCSTMLITKESDGFTA